VTLQLKKLNVFFKLLLKKDLQTKELNRLLRSIAIQKLHPLFEFCLSRIDNTLDLSYSRPFPSKKFIFEGRGNCTIKPYRILGRNQEQVFEKIFYSDSQDAEANIYFYNNLDKLLLNKDVKVPACKHIVKGNKLTAFLFEYLDLRQFTPGTEYDHLKRITISLCKKYYKDITPAQITYDKIVDGKARVKNLGIFTPQQEHKINNLIGSLPVYYQHLDLKEENVFQGDIIVDWDNAGWYPMGMDFGRLLLSYYIFHKDHFYDHYTEEIQKYHQAQTEDISLQDFQLAVIYFFIIYYYGHFCEKGETKQFLKVVASFKSSIDKVPTS